MLNYCVVKQRIGAIAEDDPEDDDRYPDYRTVSGDISFTPILSPGRSYQVVDSEDVVHTAPALRINAKIVNGEITHEGEAGVHLFAAGPNSNPPTIAYNVIYSNLTADGIPVTLGNISFVAIPGATIDLATVTPIAGTPGVGITKGDKGDPFTFEDFTEEQLSIIKGDKGDPFIYDDFTPEQLEALKGVVLRQDTTVGTRIFAGDTMLYGNTGWRKVELYSYALSPENTGVVRIKRENNTLFIDFSEVILAPGSGSFDLWFLPGGFRPTIRKLSSDIIESTNYNIVNHIVVSNTGAMIWAGKHDIRNPATSFTVNRSAETIRGGISLYIDSAWPTVLPGTSA